MGGSPYAGTKQRMGKPVVLAAEQSEICGRVVSSLRARPDMVGVQPTTILAPGAACVAKSATGFVPSHHASVIKLPT